MIVKDEVGKKKVKENTNKKSFRATILRTNK